MLKTPPPGLTQGKERSDAQGYPYPYHVYIRAGTPRCAHPAPESAAGRKVCGTIPPGLTPDPVRARSEAVESHTTPDARLVALLAELQRQDAVIAAITDEGRRLAAGGVTPASEDQEARLALANDVRDQIIKEITATPARSPAGLHAKAQATMMILDSGIASSADVSNDQLAFALAVDVLAGVQSGTDAEIVRMVDEVMTLATESKVLADQSDSLDWVASERFFNERIRPLVRHSHELRAALVPMRATTMAGFRAKARVVQEYCNCEAGYTMGDEDDAMAWSLANDILGVPTVMADDDAEVEA